MTQSVFRMSATGLVGLVMAVVAPSAKAQQVACAHPDKALGVSRVVEIDTTTGPRFGLQQYKDNDFLKPGEIVLTFDDGPLRPHTQPILNALDAQCTKATFFMVGSQAIADPEMVKRIIAKGHTVGSHTWSHADLQKISPLQARKEIELGLSSVVAAAGQPVAPFFRFPYLAHTKAMQGYTQSRGLGVFSIDVDSRDWKTKNAQSIQRDVLAQLADLGKGIILMHDIQPATAQALPALLEALRAKGYRVVQLKAKGVATTMPEYDVLARNSADRNKVALASRPLARHAMTWGAAQPGVIERAPTPAWGNTVVSGRVPVGQSPVQVGPPSVAPPGPMPAPAPATVLAPAPMGDAAQQAARVAQRRPAQDDWRDQVFGR